MNKTININLGGYFFHIDEKAYAKLGRYLDAISRSLNDDEQGKKEIIEDIEIRISELLSEKTTNERQVVSESQIDEIIKVMGQPEEYGDGEATFENKPEKTTTIHKKLFRDTNDKFFAGVASGLGSYMGVDTVWIRLMFLILALAGIGSGVLLYLALWFIVPKAKTTSQKLQMKGEPVNIDNIEKKIKEEFENLKNYDYSEIKEQSKGFFERLINLFKKTPKTH